MGYEIPETVEGRSVHSEAFDLAVAELLKSRILAVDYDAKVAIVEAIMDLFTAGQTDPQQLAAYAVSKVLAKK